MTNRYGKTIRYDVIPVVDMKATGLNISRMRKNTGMTVAALQETLGLNTPQAIYKWQRGDTLPTVDNLVILAKVFGTTIDEIIQTRAVKWDG